MKIETRIFTNDGRTPNNPMLPLVIMRGTEAVSADDPAAWFEEQFESNGWGATWRWGVYDYHHFHTTNHEVLGVSRGTARLMLGGEHGGEFNVKVGDVIIIPAGVGHKCLSSSDDFQVVGAYPANMEPDLIRAGEGNSGEATDRTKTVPLPKKDPVYGRGGPLLDHWKE